jgi:hypothetical protein
MVKSRPAVQAQQQRTLAHRCTVGDETHPRHVEIQPDITDPNPHAQILRQLPSEIRARAHGALCVARSSP